MFAVAGCTKRIKSTFSGLSSRRTLAFAVTGWVMVGGPSSLVLVVLDLRGKNAPNYERVPHAADRASCVERHKDGFEMEFAVVSFMRVNALLYGND